VMLLLMGAEDVGMLYMDMSTTSSWGIPRRLATTADLLLALLLLSRTLLHALAGHFPCRLAGEGQLLKTASRLTALALSHCCPRTPGRASGGG
jgi:hypothetical protein